METSKHEGRFDNGQVADAYVQAIQLKALAPSSFLASNTRFRNDGAPDGRVAGWSGRANGRSNEWERLSRQIQPLMLMKQARDLLDEQGEHHSACHLQNAILIYEEWLGKDNAPAD